MAVECFSHDVLQKDVGWAVKLIGLPLTTVYRGVKASSYLIIHQLCVRWAPIQRLNELQETPLDAVLSEVCITYRGHSGHTLSKAFLMSMKFWQRLNMFLHQSAKAEDLLKCVQAWSLFLLAIPCRWCWWDSGLLSASICLGSWLGLLLCTFCHVWCFFSLKKVWLVILSILLVPSLRFPALWRSAVRNFVVSFSHFLSSSNRRERQDEG